MPLAPSLTASALATARDGGGGGGVELWWLPLPATDLPRENIRYSVSQASSSSRRTRTPRHLYLSLFHDFGRFGPLPKERGASKNGKICDFVVHLGWMISDDFPLSSHQNNAAPGRSQPKRGRSRQVRKLADPFCPCMRRLRERPGLPPPSPPS